MRCSMAARPASSRDPAATRSAGGEPEPARRRSCSCRGRSRPPGSWTGSPRSSHDQATSRSTRSIAAAAARPCSHDPRPLDVSVQVADLVAYLDARGIESAILVGISFGAVLALETAARHPQRVRAIVAWEPPYIPLADAATGARIGGQAVALEAAYAEGGPPAVTERFMRTLGGDGWWERLPPNARQWLGREGTSALADAGLLGLEPEGLGRITAPTTVLDGSDGDPFAGTVADALVDANPGGPPRDDPRVRAPEPDHRHRPVRRRGPCGVGRGGKSSNPIRTAIAVRPSPARRAAHDRHRPRARLAGPDRRPVGCRDGKGKCRADPGGPRDVRPDLAGLRPDEPGDLRVPGAVLATPPRPVDRPAPGWQRARCRVGHGQGRR